MPEPYTQFQVLRSLSAAVTNVSTAWARTRRGDTIPWAVVYHDAEQTKESTTDALAYSGACGPVLFSALRRLTILPYRQLRRSSDKIRITADVDAEQLSGGSLLVSAVGKAIANDVQWRLRSWIGAITLLILRV